MFFLFIFMRGVIFNLYLLVNNDNGNYSETIQQQARIMIGVVNGQILRKKNFQTVFNVCSTILEGQNCSIWPKKKIIIRVINCLITYEVFKLYFPFHKVTIRLLWKILVFSGTQRQDIIIHRCSTKLPE